MRHTGRIVFSNCMLSAFILGFIPIVTTDGFYQNRFLLLAVIPLFAIGWILGKHYDLSRYYAVRDVLTNVYNRRYIYEIFPAMLAKAAKNKHGIVIYVVDVNNFKAINDQYGHAVGDVVLKNIANSLLRMTNETDTIVRWGGDEFIIVSSQTEGEEAVRDVDVLEQGMRELSRKMKQELSVSVGASRYPEDAEKLDDLIKIADLNMYESKEHHKERVL